MDKSTMQEIGAIWDKFNELDKKLSDFIDSGGKRLIGSSNDILNVFARASAKIGRILLRLLG